MRFGKRGANITIILLQTKNYMLIIVKLCEINIPMYDTKSRNIYAMIIDMTILLSSA